MCKRLNSINPSGGRQGHPFSPPVADAWRGRCVALGWPSGEVATPGCRAWHRIHNAAEPIEAAILDAWANFCIVGRQSMRYLPLRRMNRDSDFRDGCVVPGGGGGGRVGGCGGSGRGRAGVSGQQQGFCWHGIGTEGRERHDLCSRLDLRLSGESGRDHDLEQEPDEVLSSRPGRSFPPKRWPQPAPS
jgi:hypothetical protein